MPETTENFHWVPIRDAGLFVDTSFRQITLSADQGIHARIGKLKTDAEGSTVVQAYYFDKAKWSMDDAKKWSKDHKKASDTSSMQRRILNQDCSEMRLDFNDRTPKIRGYASVFNQKTELYEGFFEQISPGAFRESIKEDDVRALWNHNPDIILGRNKAETLKLWEDERGLGYEILPDPDDPNAQNLIRKIKRGDVSQSSFGFYITKRTIEFDEESKSTTRTIQKVKLFDVSPVTFPAYPQTEVHVRMTKFEDKILVEDEVIELTPPPEKQATSDEEFFSGIDAFLKESEP